MAKTYAKILNLAISLNSLSITISTNKKFFNFVILDDVRNVRSVHTSGSQNAVVVRLHWQVFTQFEPQLKDGHLALQ